MLTKTLEDWTRNRSASPEHRPVALLSRWAFNHPIIDERVSDELNFRMKHLEVNRFCPRSLCVVLWTLDFTAFPYIDVERMKAEVLIGVEIKCVRVRKIAERSRLLFFLLFLLLNSYVEKFLETSFLLLRDHYTSNAFFISHDVIIIVHGSIWFYLCLKLVEKLTRWW